MLHRHTRFVVATFVGLMLSSCTAPNPTVKSAVPGYLGEHGYWKIWEITTSGEHVCYIVSDPREQGSKRDGRGSAGFIMTKRPTKDTPETNLQPGFDIPIGSNIEVRVGDKIFTMVPRGKNAWLRYNHEDSLLIEEFLKEEAFTIEITLSAEQTTVDRYSLTGFREAYDRITNDCPPSAKQG